MRDQNGYEYLRNKTVDGNITYWSCRKLKTKFKCKATAKTVLIDGQSVIRGLQGEHEHSSGLLKKRVLCVEREAVMNAARNPCIAPRTVLAEICNTLQNDSLAAATSMSKPSAIKSRIQRARKELLNEVRF